MALIVPLGPPLSEEQKKQREQLYEKIRAFIKEQDISVVANGKKLI